VSTYLANNFIVLCDYKLASHFSRSTLDQRARLTQWVLNSEQEVFEKFEQWNDTNSPYLA
jgi:hypothetical protein